MAMKIKGSNPLEPPSNLADPFQWLNKIVGAIAVIAIFAGAKWGYGKLSGLANKATDALPEMNMEEW